MHIISLWIGKCSFTILQWLQMRGGALPGLIVEKINPFFLSAMLKQLPEGVIVVTGTNGKTTSTKMLATILEGCGKKVLSNPTGSNLIRGVVATIIAHTSWRGL